MMNDDPTTDDCLLLEQAAASAGFPYTRANFMAQGEHPAGWGMVCGITEFWNPLVSLHDRHQLLIHHKMTLAHEPCRGGWSVGAVVNGEFRWLSNHDDDGRAITLAASSIYSQTKGAM